MDTSSQPTRNQRSLPATLILIGLLSFIVRYLIALLQSGPVNFDEAYHFLNAVTLATGGGFSEDFIWNYLSAPDDVTHPGFAYWLPLTSMLAAVGMLVGHIDYSSAQAGFVFLAALLPPLTYLITFEVSRNSRHAWAAAILMLTGGHYFPVWTVIDSFTPFALFGLVAIYCFYRSVTDNRRGYALISGLCVGLASLTRADAPLLLVAFLLTVLIEQRHRQAFENLKPVLVIAAVTLLGYALAITPWQIRNLLAFDSTTSLNGLQTIWLCNYDDLYSYQKELSLRTWLDCGLAENITAKWQGVKSVLVTLFIVQGMIFGVPLALVGVWQCRNHLLFRLGLIYGILLFLAMSLVFTFPAMRGSWHHSAGLLLPFMFIAALAGLDRILAAMAARWRRWDDPGAIPFFTILLCALAVIMSGLRMQSYLADKAEVGKLTDAFQMAAGHIDADAVVMTTHITLFRQHTGRRTIAMPNNGIDALYAVADRYNARYVIMDKNTPPAINPIFTGELISERLEYVAGFGEEDSATRMSLYRFID